MCVVWTLYVKAELKGLQDCSVGSLLAPKTIKREGYWFPLYWLFSCLSGFKLRLKQVLSIRVFSVKVAHLLSHDPPSVHGEEMPSSH